jgi:hypothetical protein
MAGARDAAKKALNELFAWFIAASISCGVSASIISYSLNDALSNRDLSILLADALLTAFAAIWLLLSATMIYHILRIMKAHGVTPVTWSRIQGLSEEESADVIKDAVSLYRGYRWSVVAIGVALTAAGAVCDALAIWLFLTGAIPVTELLFRLGAGALMILYGALDLYLERVSIAKRLARVRVIEQRLHELIE